MNLKLFRRPVVALLLGTLLAGGCASFNHDWKKAAKQPVPPNDLTGRWQGVWVSDMSHHTDQLRCLITRRDDGTYRARFHATYHTVLHFSYTVPLTVAEVTEVFEFSGEANLGWLAGGLYQYEGHSDGTNFFSSYSCQYDHGTFQMGRPENENKK